MPEEYHHCKVRLQMEQQRFLNFSLEAGVLYSDGGICETLQIKRPLLLAVLAEIKRLFEHYAAANGKYVEDTCQVKLESDDQTDPETDLVAMLCLHSSNSGDGNVSDSSQRKHQRSKQLRKAVGQLVQTGRNLRTVILEPKRLVWAAVDKSSFENLIAKLGDLNSFLIALLDSAQMERLQLTMDTSYNEILQIRDDIRSLTGLVKALSNEPERRDGFLGATILDGDNAIRRSFLQQIETQRRKRDYLKKLTEVKIQYKHIGNERGAETAMSDREPLDPLHFVFDPCGRNQGFPANQAFATYQGRDVWIEWKNCPSNQLNADTASVRAEDRLRLLVDLLCNEIPASFRSPPCLGYIKSISQDAGTRFGMVFESPSGVPLTQVVTLHTLLQHQPKPSLSARIALCAILAECVHTFHTVNWLHKGLRSENIIFFLQPSEQNLNTPYVLGYELSRPNVLDELTEKPKFNPREDIYRHPFAQSSQSSGNYHPSYDLYSLGILLIELASWKPIQDFLGFTDLASARPSDLLAVRRRLLEDAVYLQRMSSTLGDSFKEIVELCIRADEIERPSYDGEAANSIAVRLQRSLEQNVVRKLRDMERVMKASLGG